MISVEEALSYISHYKKDFGSEDVPLLQAAGRMLAQDIVADRDLPPYHRVTMDGIAIQKASFDAGIVSFVIEGIQAAGAPQISLQNHQYCIEVMTGAVLPANTDAVIPYEDCTIDNNTATVLVSQIKAFQNIHLQGSDAKKADVLLKKGTKISPTHVALLASVGMSKVPVLARPHIAICATGNELVNIDEIPLPHQVRMSNGYMLAAALQQENITPALFHLPDDTEQMTEKLSQLKEQFDVVILSGAVSKGKYDFVPAALENLGMTTVFHRVAQKPGKPFLFGYFENSAVVFGLPGNPLSSLVCYHIYIRHWLNSCLNYTPKKAVARLAETIVFTPKLANHLLVNLQNVDGTLWATPVKTNNSGDLSGLIQAEALITLPPEKDSFEKGELFDIQSWLTHF